MATRSRIYRRVYNVRRSFYYIAPEIFTDEIVILFDVVNFALVVEARCIYKYTERNTVIKIIITLEKITM